MAKEISHDNGWVGGVHVGSALMPVHTRVCVLSTLVTINCVFAPHTDTCTHR